METILLNLLKTLYLHVCIQYCFYLYVYFLLQKELKKDYAAKYKNSKTEKYEENLKKTLSEDNLGKAMLYLGKDGKLTAICKEYASVGAGEFSVVLTLT